MQMKKALVLFSGGVDSTYTVARVARSYDRLVLMTYRTPGMIRVGHSNRTAEQLLSRFPGIIERDIVDLRGFVGQVRGGALRCIVDNLRHGFYYSWCLGCKLSMHLYTIDYCHRHGIDRVIDGNNRYDTHALEQRRDVIGTFVDLYRESGIEYGSPFYEEEDVQIRDGGLMLAAMRHLTLYKDATANRVLWLQKSGFDIGRGIGSQYRQTQPSCLVSPAFNLARIGLSLLNPESAKGIQAYLREKTDLYRRITTG
jgi:hypothetical protein